MYPKNVPAGTCAPGVSQETPTLVQQQADALALLAETALHHGIDPGAPGERYQVVVHVDAAVQSVQFHSGRECGGRVGRADFESPFCWGNSTPLFRSHPGGTTSGDCDPIHIFCDEAPEVTSPGCRGPLARYPRPAADTRRLPTQEAVKRKLQATRFRRATSPDSAPANF